MGVSTDLCIAIEHQRLSSIRVIFVNLYLYNIKDAWDFSGITLITLSGGFSSKTLTGVRGICYGKLSWIGVSPS